MASTFDEDTLRHKAKGCCSPRTMLPSILSGMEVDRQLLSCLCHDCRQGLISISPRTFPRTKHTPSVLLLALRNTLLLTRPFLSFHSLLKHWQAARYPSCDVHQDIKSCHCGRGETAVRRPPEHAEDRSIENVHHVLDASGLANFLRKWRRTN